MKKLTIISTHPIQYNAPWFRLLSVRKGIKVKVFYTWSQIQNEGKFDPGFGKNIEWDIPLLEGYDYKFVENISKTPGSKNYKGIKNPSLIKEIESWNADVLLIFGWKFQSHLKAMRYFKGRIPVLFRGDSTVIDDVPIWKRWSRKISLNFVFRNVDYALFVGTANKEYYSHAGLKEHQLVFTPHAVDNKRFTQHSKNDLFRNELRTGLKILPDDFVFLFSGKLERKKDPELLINAFHGLDKTNCHLILLGNGPLEADLKKQYGNIANLHFLPFQNQSQMPLYYSVCDAFILPSQGPGETWGLAVNEAMACGKPVIVSDKCGCAPDLVKPENGFVFEAGNVENLKRKMGNMLKSDVQKMGESSRKIIENWSFERIVESVEDLVERL